MKIKKLDEDIQHCWFGYYIDKDGNKKYFYMTKDSTSKDPDEASEIMEDSIPEPFTKFVFSGSVANTQAEKQGWKLVESKSINEGIDVSTIADYITDYYKFETIDDKYSCINSIKDSFKDEKTISKEELEQFIGAHNGKDKIEEDFGFKSGSKYFGGLPSEPSDLEYGKAMNKAYLDSDEFKEEKQHVIDFAEACKLDGSICKDYNEFAEVLADDGIVATNTLWNIYLDTLNESKSLKESKATHCVYFDYDGYEQIEFEGTEDECQDYIAKQEADDEFGDEAPERFIKRLDEEIDGWDNRTGIIKRIDKYLSINPEATPPKGYINKHSRAYDDAVSRYGDYVTTPFGNISTDDLMQYARDNKLLEDSQYQDISNVDLDNELVKDLVDRAFDYNQAQWLVDNDVEYAKHLAYDNVSEEEIAKAEKYLTSKGHAHQVEENLDESMKDYRFEVSCNDGPTKVVKLIWDEKDVEGAKEWAKKYYAQEHTTYADDRHNKWIIEESLDEALSPREGDRVQMDFYAKENNGATGTCTGRIGELCFIEWDDGTKSKEIKGYLKVIERPNMNEASYGGAFDIADDQIFTREDIDNLAEEVLNHINETYDYKFDISAAYIDGNELEVGVENDELGEYITTLKIDMRKVKEPWHLKRVYAFEVASDLINQISTTLNNSSESLTESATEDAKPIETGAALGMATVLSDLIKDEYEAIDGYNTAIATAEAEGFGDMVKVLTDIQAEENIHIGQLQELMKMVDPNASKIEDGTAEAEEILSNPSANDDDDFDFEGIDESFDVSEDDIADEDVDAAIKAVEEAMKEPNKEEIDLTNANFDLEDDDEVIVESTEPWEDIYNSFKDIEVQLNGDGEAITATIDRIYNDNKGNPDFEKAYKKWAANE